MGKRRRGVWKGLKRVGRGGDGEMVITDPEDGGTPWDRFARGIWVGMVKNQREYGAKWGNSKRKGETGASGSGGASSAGGGGGGFCCPHYAAGFLSGGGGGATRRWHYTRGN